MPPELGIDKQAGDLRHMALTNKTGRAMRGPFRYLLGVLKDQNLTLTPAPPPTAFSEKPTLMPTPTPLSMTY